MASKDVDSDAIYQQAVRKLRMLLTASEAASSSMADDNSDEYPRYIGSVDALNQQQMAFTDPPIKDHKRKYVKHNPKTRRTLFDGGNERERERHSNSWHNLTHIEGNEKNEELALVQKQEKYIGQLEKETTFCREQLEFVLQNVKDVLNEKTALKKSEEVNTAISNIFGTIQGWQNNIGHPGALDNDLISRQIQTIGGGGKVAESLLTKRLKHSNDILTNALKNMRTEFEEVKNREAEAAEQVKRSLQVAEQLRMEKSEVEYELDQMKLQIDRQQGRIRALIEEQVTKTEEERAMVEKRCHEQIQSVKDDASKHIEEIARLSTQVEHLRRMESELNRQLQDRENIADELRQEMEKRVGQLQLEAVRAKAARQDLEQNKDALKLDLDHARHELRAQETRKEVETKSVRSNLAKVEQMLMESKSEAIELAEEKAALERELNLLKMRREVKKSNIVKTEDEAIIKKLSNTSDLQVTKLEEMIRRQSHIIGELNHQCTLVTDKLEETVKIYDEEKRSLLLKVQFLEREKFRSSRLESQLEERGELHEKLCRRLTETEETKNHIHMELRQCYLACESLKQEKSALEHEIYFFKDMLKSRGLLPEKEAHFEEENVGKKSSKAKAKKQSAVFVKRNGRVFSPYEEY